MPRCLLDGSNTLAAGWPKKGQAVTIIADSGKLFCVADGVRWLVARPHPEMKDPAKEGDAGVVLEDADTVWFDENHIDMEIVFN